MSDLFAMGQAVLSSQPFSLLLGAERPSSRPEAPGCALPFATNSSSNSAPFTAASYAISPATR